MKKTQGMDEYLEAIYVLQSEGENVIGSKLADYLGVSRPTVTQTIHRLTTAGYVQNNDSREINLTENGIQRAETVIRRHRLIERWLCDVLGLDWAEAHEEASRLEHAISERVEQKLFELLGHPTTCPHGNLIPGSTESTSVRGTPLSNCTVPSNLQVVRILELAEEDLDLLRFLQMNGFVPGAPLQLRSLIEELQEVEVTVQDKPISLPLSTADRILVRKISKLQ